MKRRLSVPAAYLKSLIVPEMTLDQKVNTLYAELGDIENGRISLEVPLRIKRITEIQTGISLLLGVELP